MNTIVIGSNREQKLPSLVLEHTILKHASEPVQVIHTWDKTFPSPVKKENVSRTGFSFVRFAIPKMVGFKGLGLYLECDQIVFKDVTELFRLPFNKATVLRPKNQASVILIDCNAVRWEVEEIVKGLDAGAYSYSNLMEKLCVEAPSKISCSIPREWNSLERYEPGKTALLHYTNMSIQPWRKWGHPLARLWLDALHNAMVSGLVSLAIINKEVELKYIVPQVAVEARKWNVR